MATELQAARAAKQLHYHRQLLPWIEQKVNENRHMLAEFLTDKSPGEEVLLPGGYVALLKGGDVHVRQLEHVDGYEQLELPSKELIA